ncbi:60Kd inner membrane protein-domain-containing protein [Rhodofomes roseus]|uniref:60Kd inner membrane protein-domain-containing protein n=1 Tax=Rhodofomes roseus TaxID=34475 RepID=A0ABQ8KZK9_9APHY|nr:60Kd inner membrane protein-domain-containing protein [Rhodofomes roseus]KAH9844255.1 60Kd inner membrane protein-domain-containing protein [Rhodofomes roseus]
MFARCSTLRPTRHALHLPRAQPARPRKFTASAIQTLTDGFLDLAIALPYPASLPPYSTTIILVTVASRLIFTVPFSVWAKNRQWRAEHVVMPQVEQEIPELNKQAIADMKKDGYRGELEVARKERNKRLKVLADARKKELLVKHGCTPLPTMLIPPITQLPLFVGFTVILSRASQAPTGFDSESFLTLTSLSHSDPTLALPIVVGLVTLMQVESTRWFASAAAMQRQAKVAEWVAARRAKGEAVLEPGKIVQSGLRGLSVARILIAAVVPGSVQVYWATSAVFGLVQSWVLNAWDARRTRRDRQSLPPQENASAKSSNP